jgi:hypothetical protein
MNTCFRIYLVPVLFISVLLIGCWDPSRHPSSEMKKRIDVEVGAVQKAAVLSTDGQEVPLDAAAFLNELPAEGKELELSDRQLRREDVRYTLIFYRKVGAPLVLEVGKEASQFGDKTYRGSGAVTFYRWVRKLTGQALLQAAVRSIELSANDLGRSLLLKEQEAASVWQAIQAAEYLESAEARQYPLYPHYRVKLDTGNRVLTVTVLTPTMISIPFGKETHYYRIDGSLFSTLTKLVPPHEIGADAFDALFKASEITVQPIADRSFSPFTRKMSDSTVEQAISHQCIRMLKGGLLQSQPVRMPRQELYQIRFGHDGKEKMVQMYKRYFVYEGKVYAHSGIDQTILAFFGVKRK